MSTRWGCETEYFWMPHVWQFTRRTGTGDFVTDDGSIVSSIERVHCKSCGERCYDKEAARAIDNALRTAGRLKK